MESPRQTGPARSGKRRALRRLTSAGLLALVSLLAAVLAPSSAGGSSPLANGVATENPVLVDSGPLGGTNGIYFDADNNLWIATVFGGTLTKVDPETGEILEQLGPESGVFFPDDVTFGPDGSMYWTEILFGAVMKRTPTGEIVQLVAPGGIINANPITISEDGERLFVAGCYAPLNGTFEVDPETGDIVSTIRMDEPGCSSNAFDFVDDLLWSPRPFENRIVTVDPATGDLTDVSTGFLAPLAVKFNSKGELFAGGQEAVVRIDLDNVDVTANREVVADLPNGWFDNLAFDKDDRLFVSSSSDGTIAEVLENGSLRTVVPGTITLPLGLAVMGDYISTSNGQQLATFDKRTGETVEIIRSVAGLGPFPFLFGVSPWGDYLVGVDAFFGELVIIDPKADMVVNSTTMTGPADAVGFGDDLLVTDFATGEIVRFSADLESRETIATGSLPLGITADDNNAFVATYGTGEVLQVIEDGVVLEFPKVVASELAGPEGLSLHNYGQSLLVVEGAAGMLTQIDLATGAKSTVASGFDFLPENPVFPFAYFNDVVSDGEAIFVAADGSNTIHRFETCYGMTEAQALDAGYTVDDRSKATGRQIINGTAGPDWIIGSEHRDIVRGKSGPDAICTRGGRDFASGGAGGDHIHLGDGNDVGRGGQGNDVIHGGDGNDRLRGNVANDTLDGGDGNDRLRGNPGEDTLTGGDGNDVMGGGPGADVCTDVMPGDRAKSCRRG